MEFKIVLNISYFHKNYEIILLQGSSIQFDHHEYTNII